MKENTDEINARIIALQNYIYRQAQPKLKYDTSHAKQTRLLNGFLQIGLVFHQDKTSCKCPSKMHLTLIAIRPLKQAREVV